MHAEHLPFNVCCIIIIIIIVIIIISSFTEYVQTGPYNKTYTESQLQAGGGFILPDFNEEQVGGLKEPENCREKKLAQIFLRDAFG